MTTSYLVDSHTLLWAVADPGKLSPRSRSCLEGAEHRIFVSHATIWELSIKVTIGKITLPKRFFDELPGLGYEMLPMSDEHFSAYRQLPLHHRDPFDRMLVAQAKTDGLAIISHDTEIGKYDVPVF